MALVDDLVVLGAIGHLDGIFALARRLERLERCRGWQDTRLARLHLLLGAAWS